MCRLEQSPIGNREDHNINSKKTSNHKGTKAGKRQSGRPPVKTLNLKAGNQSALVAKIEFGDNTGGVFPSKARGQGAGKIAVGRGRRPMPALKIARQELTQTQKDVAKQTKAVLAAQLALSLAEKKAALAKSGSKSVVKFRTALIKATRLLNSAKSLEAKASQRLAKVIASETVRVSADTNARTIALFKGTLEQKTEADLQKAVIRFISAWKKKRDKSNSLKLALFIQKADAKAANASRKANAKAKAAIQKLVVLSKARTRKSQARVRAKAVKLGAKVGSGSDWFL